MSLVIVTRGQGLPGCSVMSLVIVTRGHGLPGCSVVSLVIVTGGHGLPGYRVVVHEQPGQFGTGHLSVMPENTAGEDEDEAFATQVTAA